jgi:adenylyltransferase/sulfurtransferase
VLGVLPGTVGTIQATEAVKLLVGHGDPLEGRLVVYDAAGMSFETVPYRRNPDCPVCGEQPAIDSVRDVEYSGGCGLD